MCVVCCLAKHARRCTVSRLKYSLSALLHPPPSTLHLYAIFIVTCATQFPPATAPVPEETVVVGGVSPVLKVKQVDEQAPEQVSGRTRAGLSPVSPLASQRPINGGRGHGRGRRAA